MLKNPKNWGKLMKIANIDRDFLHVFWPTWGNSTTFSGKMCFKIVLKVTKNQGFTLCLEDTFFWKTTKPPGGVRQIDPPPPPWPLLDRPTFWCRFDVFIDSINQFQAKVFPKQHLKKENLRIYWIIFLSRISKIVFANTNISVEVIQSYG